jgi:hypothetical protein
MHVDGHPDGAERRQRIRYRKPIMAPRGSRY